MIRKLLHLFLFVCFTNAKGQNLVLNPSLDVFITCPGFGQFNNTFISNWNKPTIASSDYYNYNCVNIPPTVQAPYSGEGYAGIIAYNFGTEYREYITGTLASPLTAGKTYQVEFYASLNDGYIQAITELGAYLSASAPGPFSNALHINVIPQIENQLVSLVDTSQWMKVSGQFVATGGEQFITIGNFHDDVTTTITQPGTIGSYGAYYFIDAVSVVLDSTTSLQNAASNPELNLWLSQEMLHMELNNISPKQFPLQLTGYNSVGQKILNRLIFSPSINIELPSNDNGVYFFSVSNTSGVNLHSKAVLLK